MGNQPTHFRAHERRSVRLDALVRHDPAAWVREARVVDLSPAGACLAVAEPIEKDARLILEILAPTLWDPLVLRGLAIWCGHHEKGSVRVGITFVHDNPEALFGLFEVLGART